MEPQESVAFWLSYAMRSFTAALLDVLREHCEARGKPYVLTPQQFGLMKLLSSDEALTISLLGKQLTVEAPAITGIVTRLEQTGLVERVHDRVDRRLVKVSLTAEGKDIIGSLDPIVAAFEERVLPHDQKQSLIQQLQAFVANIPVVA